MMYCAICTSIWMPGDNPDESFMSESFEEAFAFCLKRPRKAAVIIKVDGEVETEIVSFRTVQ